MVGFALIEGNTLGKDSTITERQSFQVSAGRQTVADLRFDAMLVQMTPVSQHKCCMSARFFDGFHAQDDSDPGAPSMSQHLLVWLMRISRTNWLGAVRDMALNGRPGLPG